MKQIRQLFIAVLLAGIPSMLLADRRPPETMCEGGVCGSSLEVPVHMTPVTGGVTTSTPTYHDRGHFLSQSLGEPFSGEMQCSGGTECNQDIHLGMGYGFFEFYSDRLPMYDVSLTVNGGSPVTNQVVIDLGIQFKDDLSGFAEASFTQRTTGQIQQLDLNADNFFTWPLGDSSIPDGEYIFDFYFKDRAGNATVIPATASVTLDRVPPPFGSVVINNGNLVTATPVVNLNLQASDDRTGVAFVRLANSTDATGVVYPFIEPGMTIQWRLDSSTGGIKTVYAWFRDGAGNWTTQASSDTITLDQFQPNGTMTFVADNLNVIEVSPGGFQTKILSVPIRFDWSPLVVGVLKSIRISGGPTALSFDVPAGATSVPQPYAIASDIPSHAPDGLYTVNAVFIDIDGKESAPISKTILLNRNAPPNPVKDDLQIYSSSLTIVFHNPDPTRDIRYFTVIPDPSSVSLGASSATIPVNVSTALATFTNQGLKPNTPYIYSISAHDQISGSFPGLQVSAVTRAEPPVTSTPPTGVEISVIRVAWGTGNNPVGTEYQVAWSKDPAFPPASTSFTPWSFHNPVDIEGLDVGTAYYFHAAARNTENATTPFVDLGQGVTLSYIQPQAPFSFFADHVSSSSVVWKWLRNPSTERGWQIVNSTQGLVADIPLTISTNTYTYEEKGLSPNTVVSRFIYSYNYYLNNDFTRSASIGATVVIPPAPPVALPLAAHGSEITATWGANGNPTGTEYQAEIARNDSFTDRQEASDWIQDLSFIFRGLAPQTTYYARVRARGQVFQGNQVLSDYVSLGSIPTQTFSASGEVDIDNSAWQLHLPPHALDQDFTLQMEMNPARFTTVDPAIIQRANEKAYHESNGYKFPLPGGIVEITLTDVNGNPIHPTLNKAGDLIHLYQVSNGQSIQGQAVKSQGGPALDLPDPFNPQSSRIILSKTLRLYVLDTKTETWFRLPTNNVDVFLSKVEGGVQRFGIFSVMGSPSLDVNDVISFPVPWRPNGPNAGSGPGQTGTEADGITFGDIPQEGTIKIFDLQGALVKEITLNGNPLEPWDVRNTNGEKVASGTYYWVAESGGNRKTGKLMVIR